MIAIFKRVPNGVVVKDGVTAEVEAFPELPRTLHPLVESDAAFEYLTSVDTQVSVQMDIFKQKLRGFVNDFTDTLKDLPRAVELEVLSLIIGIVLQEFTDGDNPSAMYEKVGGVLDILVSEGKANKVPVDAFNANLGDGMKAVFDIQSDETD